MRKLVYRCSLIIIVLVFAFSFTACGSGNNDPQSKTAANGEQGTADKTSGDKAAESEPLKLRLYLDVGPDELGQSIFKYGLGKMKEVMPDVDVVHEPYPRDDYQQLKTYAAAGNLPDMFESNMSIISLFKKSNNILELTKYADELGLKDKIAPSCKNLIYDDEQKVWAMPRSSNTVAVIYYNKELFSKNGVKVPENYDEFLSAVKTFSSKDIIPVGFFAKEKWIGLQFFDVLATRMEPLGIKKLDSGAGSITEAAYVKAAEKFYELVKAGVVAKGAFNTDYDQACSLFKEGKVAMLLNGTWDLKTQSNLLGDKIGLMYYPLQDATASVDVKWNMSGGAGAGGDSGIGVSPNTKNPDKVAKYALQLGYYMAEGAYVKGSSADSLGINPPKPEVELTNIIKQYSEDSKNFKTSTVYEWSMSRAQVYTALEDNVQRLMTGEYLPADFIKDTDAALKKANANK